MANNKNNNTPGNWDQIAGQWKQIMGEARVRWGKLTNDQWDQIAGQRDKLVGKIQELYGTTKEEATQEVDEWAARLKR